MSVISLNAEQVKTLNEEIASLDDTLLGQYLPELDGELASISGNVQGTDIHNILNTIKEQFGQVKSALSTELPKLEDFLAQQMSTYQATEEQLKTEVDSALTKMADFTGMQKGGSEGGNQTPTSTEGGTETPAEPAPAQNTELEAMKQELELLKQQNQQLQAELNKTPIDIANEDFVRDASEDNAEFAERFASDWANAGEGWQNGLLSGITNTLGATWNTAANGVGYLWNQASNGVEWVVDAVLGDTLGDALGWLLG